MSTRTYMWWCPDCERGCDEPDDGLLQSDSEGYALCPYCKARLIGFDERED